MGREGCRVGEASAQQPHGPFSGRGAQGLGSAAALGTHSSPRARLQPTMQDSSQEWERIRAPSSTVQRLMRTPSSTTTPAPIVTLGPMTQFPGTPAHTWMRCKMPGLNM
uniref:Uncharacterized protein n=1 Tax=Zosterops lateralis melanops TaxID=1220523 RepID=A0A8D2QVW7_ZOSLA